MTKGAPFPSTGRECGAPSGKLDPVVCTLKKVNRALEGDFCQNHQTLNFLLWRLPELSKFLHLPSRFGEN